MAGEVQLNSVTALTESSGSIVLNNVDSATNRTNLGLAIGSDVQEFDSDTTKNDVANTFSANQTISVTDNTNAALSVTQLGTGNALIVNDEGSETTPFVIDASGNVGIGTTAPVNKLAIIDSNDRTEGNGQIVISGNGYSAFHFLDASAYHIGQNSNARTLRFYSGSNEGAGASLSAGGTSFGTYSDERLKQDWTELENAVEKLSNIRCGTYRFISDDDDRELRIGIIAQDLIGKVDECLQLENGFGELANNGEKYYSIRYTEIIPVLIKAHQEQQTIIESQQSQINALTERITALETT